VVAADRSRIKQALLNLYRNACQAVTSGGDIRSGITLSDSYVSIQLSNTQQHSLPPEIAEKIFEPFYTTKEKGIGLGLPMAKQVVEAHGGSLSVSENSENQITFIVQLPVAHDLQSNTPLESKAAHRSESPLPLQRSQSA
jgi:signal transduction histidine kinase